MDERTITRRGLLARGAALIGAVAVPAACGGGGSSLSRTTPTTTTAADERLTVYRLNVGTAGCSSRGTCSCKACAKHAENKVFATSEAANANRAHRYCNCVVGQAGTLPRATYVELFGEPTSIRFEMADRRRPGVADKLRELKA